MAMLDRINKLVNVKDKLELGGSEEAVAMQHSSGKLTARERLLKLFDENSFVEIDPFVQARGIDFNMSNKKIYGDGVVTGYGSINDRLVFAAAQDFTVLDGSMGEMHAKKIVKVIDLAMKSGVPFVNLIDSKGARLEEGLDALAGYGGIVQKSTKASGVIPQISVIMGPCVGATSLYPMISDFVFMVENTSFMSVNSNQIINANKGLDYSQEDLGGAKVHSTKSGVAHFSYKNDDVCIEKVRELIDYLPDNNLSEVPIYGPSDDSNRLIDELNIDYNENFDVRNIINSVVDFSSFLEIQKDFATNMVVGLARLDGATVGIVANQYSVDEGRISVDASNKASRFIRFCDAFNISIITFTNTVGFKIDDAEEFNGLSKNASKLMFAFSEATVPKVNIIIGKAYGSAYVAMNSKHIGADFVYAWPNADISIMNPDAAANILFNDVIAESEDPINTRVEMANDYSKTYSNPLVAASKGYVDDVIEPSASRVRLINALEVLVSKNESVPSKKHGNIPL